MIYKIKSPYLKFCLINIFLCFLLQSGTGVLAQDMANSDNGVIVKESADDKGHEPPSAPNTIKGLITNGREGDFALLRGFFVKKDSEDEYTFMDDNHDVLKVILKNRTIQQEIYANRPYFIWGRIVKVSKNEAVFNIISLNMPPNLVNVP